MKIIKAEEKDGIITATVRFNDGMDQTVTLPNWADREIIRKEARRLREDQERKNRARKERLDLVE